MPTNLDLCFNGRAGAATTIVLAHGAGAGRDTPFMNFFAEGLAEKGYQVARFKFPYMAARTEGVRKPPDREPTLRETWLNVIGKLRSKRLVIGGKSMGGRIASLVADDAKVAGLICLGYPFHPAGRPERLRVKHLETIRTPTLIVQGERDTMGSRDEVARYELSPAVRVAWMADGDHSFKPRRASGRTEEQNWSDAIDLILGFLDELGS